MRYSPQLRYEEHSVASVSTSRSVAIGENGRMNLPADMRRKLGLSGADKVFVEQDDDGVVTITSWPQRLARIRATMAPYIKPGDSVVDEFIADRRSENAKDEAEMSEHETYRRG
jgi:AbrB family looped-hinge helix DNA binding protein